MAKPDHLRIPSIHDSLEPKTGDIVRVLCRSRKKQLAVIADINKEGDTKVYALSGYGIAGQEDKGVWLPVAMIIFVARYDQSDGMSELFT